MRICNWRRLIGLLPAAAGCSNSSSAPPEEPVATVRISPRPAALLVGQSVQLQAQALTSSGDPVPGTATTWSLTDSSKGAISQLGLLSATDAGSLRVIATIADVSDSVALVIFPNGPDTILVTPRGDTLAIGTQVALTATVLDALADTLPGAVVAFVSSEPSVATVSTTGIVSAVGTGTAVITAASGGAATTVHLLVPQCAPLAQVHANSFTLPVRAGGTEPSGSFEATGLYKGRGVLYGGGLVLGTSSQLTVVGYDPSDLASDFTNAPVCELNGPTASHTYSRLVVAPGAVGPTGLRITQETFADTPVSAQDFVLFRYTVVNTGTTPVSGIRLGFAADWDLDFDFNSTDDVARISATSVALEIQEPDSITHPQVLGLVSIGGAPPSSFAWLNGTSVTRADFYNQLGISPPSPLTIRGDVRALVGRGTYSIPPRGQITVYFALVGGDTRAAFLANVAAAQQAAATLGFP